MPQQPLPSPGPETPERDRAAPPHGEAALRTALARERAAAEELRRLADLNDALLSAVSHELRTPLTVLQGFAELLLTVGDDLPPTTRDAAIVAIERNARRLNDLLVSILDLDRLQRDAEVLSLRDLPLREVVRDVLDALALPSHRVEVEIGDLRVSADRGKLERIVENLLANALKHGTDDHPVTVRAWSQEGGVLLEIADRGPGVPQEHREAIFEPFDRSGAAAATPGTGIGLALVRGFVELHGGRVWVDDHRGGGAAFRVWLPGGGAAGDRAGLSVAGESTT
jgi:two-component system, OmpR family, sensor histidine kinase KdpD